MSMQAQSGTRMCQELTAYLRGSQLSLSFHCCRPSQQASPCIAFSVMMKAQACLMREDRVRISATHARSSAECLLAFDDPLLSFNGGEAFVGCTPGLS